jgi:cytochrome c553
MRIRRRTKRRVKRAFLALPLLAAGGFLYLVLRSPSSAPPANISVDRSAANVERGRYLFTAVAACDRCHSGRDFSKLNGPVIASRRGAGRAIEERGLPGEIVAPNLTPDAETGLGRWSDGEIVRAIREGIGIDGRALYFMMPYPYYRRMSDEDVRALVAYLRSLNPVRSALPRTRVSFLTRILMKGEPQPVLGEIPPVDPGAGEVYGEYLATIAACEECHTPRSWWGKDTSMRFAGGRFFDTAYGQVYSANITSDEATGVGAWDYKRFEERMRHHSQYAEKGAPAAAADQFTVMPWESYAQLNDEDLEALFLYMRAIKPVTNPVSRR